MDPVTTTTALSATEVEIQIDWIALTTSAETGGSAITSYELHWNQGSTVDEYVALVGSSTDYTSTSYTISTGLTAGETYTFKILAKNRWGSGEFSTTTSVVAALSS